MTDAEKLSLAYQLNNQDPATYPDLASALAKVEADAMALAPAPPSPGDVVGMIHVRDAKGQTIKHVSILGDGSEVAQ